MHAEMHVDVIQSIYYCFLTLTKNYDVVNNLYKHPRIKFHENLFID
jgi:hypothetical protein